MSQPREVGEPIVNVEKVVTVLPDGRKVIKTIKKITHSYQVEVPEGTPIPEGAHIVSTTAAEAPSNNKVTHFQSSSSGSGSGSGSDEEDLSSLSPQELQQFIQNGTHVITSDPTVVVQSTIDDNGRKVTKTTTATTTSSTSANPQDLRQFIQDGAHTTSSEPIVVVQSTVDDNGRKVTKTTTTTSSSSGPFSKLFKRLSLTKPKTGAKSSNNKSDSKPLPSIPAGLSQPQAHKVQFQPEVKVQTVQVEPEIRIQEGKPEPQATSQPGVHTLEYKKADGTTVPLSDCSGDRRAVLIGINYPNGPNPLNGIVTFVGCVNDTAKMKTFLLGKGFKEENIRMLTDDQVGTQWMPTRENIIHNIKWLVHDAKTNDSYFLHYSGHGGQTIDLDGDETYGKDNCIFPVDYVENGVIIDDYLHLVLVKTLPEGVRLTALFDCCHSGSALDLPYVYASTGYIRGSSALANLGHELVEKNFDADAMKVLQEKWKKLQEEEKEFARQVSLKAADGDVIMFSGCQDDQTSADVKITRSGQSTSNGAMTYAFTKCVCDNPELSYQDMLKKIRTLLKEKNHKQKPQLSSSRPMDMAEMFHM
ncbi:Ca(2+)-dependent cysteine protease [Modicella reniformis]|uniref:Ca(2+)-dependent cysteine protease n=1 Tax=Modicella reniformis TaxID=1440133 RepID=A0A9P6STJ5_9FUNG|nr:Ca(2+)-dependent cysteine protease [Modicella reniformis]